MNDGLMELERRLRELDGTPYEGKAGDLSTDLGHFIFVMERINSSGTPLAVGNFLCKSAKEADAIQKRSRLLARLERTIPEIVIGPLKRHRQYWIGTGNLPHQPKAELTLSKSHFIDVTSPSLMGSARWFRKGLFTSTAFRGTSGMWRMYLKHGGESSLFLHPWHIWVVKPEKNIRILEIISAEDWVKFVLSYPYFELGVLYPDWKAAAQDFDAIHITVRAIFAIQGIHFSTGEGIIAPSYWDVESTFWLHWRFGSVRLVKIEKGY